MELTGKQKRHLRSLGQRLEPAVTVGKAGLSDAAIANLSRLLDQHELVKVRIPAGSADDRDLMGMELAQKTASACANVLGRTVLLFRANPKLAKPIALPGGPDGPEADQEE